MKDLAALDETRPVMDILMVMFRSLSGKKEREGQEGFLGSGVFLFYVKIFTKI
ncbi:MAG: hypothetical protein GY797_32215 [Deltaproteobacteria bacterium]|nr:hypothetical protein [Deltaproteobacteria bacterium]